MGIPTDAAGTAARSNSQLLATGQINTTATVIDNTTQSITVLDGSGVDNSGVLVMASVSIRTTGNSTLPNANRFAIWLQRSNDGFVANRENVFKTESAVASGTTSANPPNTSTGNITVPILFPDLNLAPGTYTYRLVFQPNNFSNAGTPNFEAVDRSMVLLQIKR